MVGLKLCTISSLSFCVQPLTTGAYHRDELHIRLRNPILKYIVETVLTISDEIMFPSKQQDSSKDQPDFWNTIQANLTELTSEYKSCSGPFLNFSKEASRTESSLLPSASLIILTKEAKKKSTIPRGEKINILRLPALMKNSKASGAGGGVNHLNLIQIKGNPAHSWQPRVEEGRLVVRPDLTGLKMNSLLLKIENSK